MSKEEKIEKANALLAQLVAMLQTEEPEYDDDERRNEANWQAEYARRAAFKIMCAANADGRGACEYCGG